MELVAGDVREILVAIGTGDGGSLRDFDRFDAYLSLSGGLDPTWLDLFAEAVRASTDQVGPTDFIDARIELGGGGGSSPADPGTDLVIERVDPAWIAAVALIPDRSLDAIAGQWIDRLEGELGALPSEEKPWIRELTADLVRFCRQADRALDVVFIWSL